VSAELQSWFKDLPGKVQREFAKDLRRIADGLADDIRAAAPTGETGRLKESVRVTRGKKSLELFVEAGGALTTKEVRAGSGVTFDYALAQEFGTERQPAYPFFYATYRVRRDDVRAEIERAVADAIARA
jgi:HK97 gp10 family phage protein